MGILNVTRESFYDGGRYALKEKAIEQAYKLEKDGADIIDIGGESTRPGADPVREDEELERVIPVIEAISKHSDIVISVDTTKAGVARRALEKGADIINDVSALAGDSEMTDVVVESGVPVVLMHMRGRPKTMQRDVDYEDCLKEIVSFLVRQSDMLIARGYDREQIIIDPGIGFGKKLLHNLDILGHIHCFTETGMPVLIGPSRKSFIGEILDAGTEERLSGTLAALVSAVQGGAAIVRVHDVKEVRDFFKVFNSIEKRK